VDNAVNISHDLTAVGQVQLLQLQQAVQEGYRSVLNLRSPDELGFLKSEPQMVKSLGLRYVNLPLRLEELDETTVTQILQTIERLPKPIVVHCAAGIRSFSISLLRTAIQDGLTVEETMQKARSLGFHYIDSTLVSPTLKQRFVTYLTQYSRVRVAA
jgi:uncharacterized protein (TIGR01244 family)